MIQIEDGITNINNSLNNYYDKTQIDSQNSNLQSQISGLASGKPLIASSVSEMTDTEHIYVNTSDGYWYYYDGTDGFLVVFISPLVLIITQFFFLILIVICAKFCQRMFLILQKSKIII